jgi:putative ATP-dependent endonuclease of OLD family
MRIAKVTINNFRSVKSAVFEPSVFNVLVGQNNHGKTNIFEAISWFYNPEESIHEIAHNRSNDEVSVEIEFTDVQDGLEKMKNDGNKTTLKKQLGSQGQLRVIRKSSEIKKRLIWDEKAAKWVAPGTGFDKALDDALPRLEYVSTKIHLSDVAKYGKKTPIGLMLSGVLTTILEENEQYKQFRTKFEELFSGEHSGVKVKLEELSGKVKLHLEQQFPDCTKVSFAISEPAFDDLLKNFDTTVNDGVETTAEEKGDGMQRALMLAIIKTYADYRKSNEDQGKNFLFLLDEAEIHLHPTAQRQLKEVLLSIAEQGDQVFLNTHSSVLIADNDKHQSIFRVEKSLGQTSISAISEKEKYSVVYELLGGNPADLLLPHNFVIVEGHSDSQFISLLVKRFYADKSYVQIVAAGGDTQKQAKSMDAINTVFLPLHLNPIYKVRLGIVCDQPNKENTENFAAFNTKFSYLQKNGQLFVLPVGSIEEYYPTPWRKTADEVKLMDAAAKVQLAKEAGTAITQVSFESGMPILFAALSFAWEKAY